MKTKTKKTSGKFIVRDWTGQEMNFGRFKSFDDAWDFIREKFEDEEDWQEYAVCDLSKGE